MGLNFSHGAARWSYSGFNKFRKRLAAVIGVDLDKMQGFAGWDILSSKPVAVKEPPISWDTVSDPIVPLLHHSDCDGDLSPEVCATVAPRLRELVDNWPEDYDKRNALMLAQAMEQCAKDGVPLEFR